jgi:hypothetical protein
MFETSRSTPRQMRRRARFSSRSLFIWSERRKSSRADVEGFGVNKHIVEAALFVGHGDQSPVAVSGGRHLHNIVYRFFPVNILAAYGMRDEVVAYTEPGISRS